LMAQKGAVAAQLGGNFDRIACELAGPLRRLGRGLAERAPHPLNHFRRRRFVATDADTRRTVTRGNIAQIDPALDRAFEDGFAPLSDFDRDGVEIGR
jgi:hypothetical protein